MLMSTFTNILWAMILTFLVAGYFIVMFHIVVDLVRRSDLGGWGKAAWIIGLLFVPIITALIYVIANGSGMAGRQNEAAQQAVVGTEAYVKRIAGTSSSDEIAKAKALLDSGTINEGEYATLKNHALHAAS
jgi:uncharacterized membrane protein